MENLELLDFEKAKVQTLSLAQLKRTHKENDIMGQPLKGIYHYQLIERIEQMINEVGLTMQINEIFAAQNKEKNQPGVVILPQVEEQFGYRAIEAHVLRRVFANISINDMDDSELTTNMAIVFHQAGIQVAFGNMVKVCHNQCLLGNGQVVSNFGDDKKTLTDIFETIAGWLCNYKDIIQSERDKILRMREVIIPPERILMMIGEMTAIRVAHDTAIKEIRQSGTYPLNQAQISQFTENLLVVQRQKEQITLWDIYNAATELLKADHMEIPNIIPQHLALTQFLQNYL